MVQPKKAWGMFAALRLTRENEDCLAACVREADRGFAVHSTGWGAYGGVKGVRARSPE